MLVKKISIFLCFLLPLLGTGATPHADSSVLAKGQWYKFVITHTGIHQITYQDLSAMGVDPSTIDVDKIRLFGNGSGMLPEVNSAPRVDDLREISIQVEDGGDGHFDATDYLLFYGEGADKWNYDRLSRSYSHQRNLYSDSTYYFLNFDQGSGKRVGPLPADPSTPNYFSTVFDDYLLHELDQLNLIRSGREWYGETFDNQVKKRDFPFYFPNIDSLSSVKVKWYAAASAPVANYFYLSQAGKKIDSLRIDSTNPTDYTLAGMPKYKITSIPAPSPDQTMTITYGMPTSNSKGWLNFLELSCRRNLVWVGPQMLFRDLQSLGQGRITEFAMKNTSTAVKVWDVTTPSSIKAIDAALDNGILRFRRATDSLREFIAFDGTSYYPVTYCGVVQNQNLHANQPTSLVIVSNPLFLAQADQLGEFHRQHNGLSVQVVSVADIYNEFACGQGDPTAIRDYMKMLYDRGSAESRPKYLLLFGDGSYDPKNRIPGNNNLIPTFQSVESLNSTKSYVTDDYFGIMADNSGQEANGAIDIGIGRFPVSTLAEAQTMVDKIIHYSAVAYPVTSDWRNIVTFVADDENQNLHFQQAEELCAIVKSKYPVFNVNKIYFDAYQLIQIPGGERFPDASAALNDVVDKGSLIINYTGHGGETGWSFEQVLTTTDILAWKNKDKLPVFVTATCEFSRFDNPERFTAGEMLILQPGGGAIALYSTTRLAFAGLNIQLNTSFFNHLMDMDADGKYIRMGDLIRLSKNENSNNFQLRNFLLLGDPAQNIAFSGYNVKTTSINEQPVNQTDTVVGMSTVTVRGIIEDGGGQKISTFNGTVNCKLYDKPVTNTTLGNRPENHESYPANFNIQNSLLFKGDVPVVAGEFLCSFVVPKNILLQYGKGKLSYFAFNDDSEASGFFDQIVVGGRDGSVNPVNQGPDISLYLDDRSFVSGGETGSAAILLVDLFDTNGINSLGLGIGHEIEAVLDNDRANAMVLNDYYAADFNSYTRGTLAYPLDGLTSGTHTLTLKAWDMFDNSSLKEITFYVPASHTEGVLVKNVMNAPNPLVDQTNFIFQPQQSGGGGLDVQIKIYNLKGIQVYTILKSYSDPLISTPKISWDGTDSNGKKLSNGIYPYKITFKSNNGAYSETSQKLMIMR
ncbi:MAG: type IX secretion system sortase PorU [Bacteroidetes bacterium]|nr:type IX secretion system sortase PorU [Bacteroidota bacterium]